MKANKRREKDLRMVRKMLDDTQEKEAEGFDKKPIRIVLRSVQHYLKNMYRYRKMLIASLEELADNRRTEDGFVNNVWEDGIGVGNTDKYLGIVHELLECGMLDNEPDFEHEVKLINKLFKYHNVEYSE